MDKILGGTLLAICGITFIQQMYYMILCGAEAIRNADNSEE